MYFPALNWYTNIKSLVFLLLTHHSAIAAEAPVSRVCLYAAVVVAALMLPVNVLQVFVARLTARLIERIIAEQRVAAEHHERIRELQ